MKKTSKHCPNCGEDRSLRHFVKRSKPKKDGSPSYESWCKACIREKQRVRAAAPDYKSGYTKKKAEERECVVCESIFYSSHGTKQTCSDECSDKQREKNWKQKIKDRSEKTKEVNKEKEKMRKISSKYLTRGTIHYQGHI